MDVPRITPRLRGPQAIPEDHPHLSDNSSSTRTESINTNNTPASTASPQGQQAFVYDLIDLSDCSTSALPNSTSPPGTHSTEWDRRNNNANPFKSDPRVTSNMTTTTTMQETPEITLDRGYHKVVDVEELLKRAKVGDVNSQLALGDMYKEGRGVKKNYNESMKWYRKAADTFGAARWYLKCAEQGSKAAHMKVGELYMAGSGVSQHEYEALKW
ncbi:hypothetical protein BGZ95_010007 [Linnemannia exigua]|uniref:HCP-like protein n=1 Tax=Linnemannia exigua TaxID=604196 RepID=A0AAD4H597_9FUNG|nr:hypothetical protein BGZ95_010007 [Linnemannia exigua]